MFSVHLREIPRTISFRTALMSLALFSCSFLALFGYIYWQTAGYLLAEVDTALYRQIDNRSAQPEDLRLAEIRKHSDQDIDGRLPHGLYDAQGQLIAGAVGKMPAFKGYDKPAEFSWKQPQKKNRPIRFIMHRLDNGQTLMVAQDIHDLSEFDELLGNAMVSGGSLLLLVGLLGAVGLGYAARRRLDVLTRSIERIVKGHLNERLPTRGNRDDIDRIATVVNQMLDELERLMSEVKGVCDDIAHDLRTPLTRLLAGLERAQRRHLREEQYQAAIDNAIEDAQGLLSTFRALLRISEIEASARRSSSAEIALNRIAADAPALFEPLAEERGIELTLNCAPAA